MLLVPVSQWLVHLLEFLKLLFGDLITVENIDIILGDGFNFALLVLRQVLGGELINWVIKNEHFIALLDVLLKDWATLDGVKGVSREVKDGVLVILHAGNIFIKGYGTFWVVGGMESKQNDKINNLLTDWQMERSKIRLGNFEFNAFEEQDRKWVRKYAILFPIIITQDSS